ncbi:hypothetical protein D3C74_402010 [compost metagenome]
MRRTANTTHDNRNIFISLMAVTGGFNSLASNRLGILLRKKRYSTPILATSENRFGTNILPAYSINVIPKKSADTMLTRLLTTSGKEVVSAINPLAIINGNTLFSSKFSARTMARTIGVSISAPPSLAKKAETTAPRMEM